MTHRKNSLDRRVARLEFQNKFLSTVIGFFLVVFLLGAASNERIVEASGFRLLDESGRLRAELTLRDGNPGLYLRDAENVERIALFHAWDAAGLYVSDESGTTRIGIAQFAHGGGGVALHGPDSKGAAVLYFGDSGSLRFFDADGQVTNSVSANPD